MILLVAAVREELGDLPGEALGIGPVAAGARMARILAETPPSAVVLLGTAGSYPGGPSIGSACKVRRVGLIDGVAMMGLGYTPRPPAPVTCDHRLLSGVDLPEYDALTVGAVTTDRLLAERLSDGWQVEHLEAFGAAYACHDAGVPFAAILGISNDVGPDAHAQWLTHRNEAQEAVRRAVVGADGGGSPLFEGR